MHLSEILDQFYTLPESSKKELESYMTEVSYPKGYILLQADRVEKDIYFLKKGVVRAYATPADSDVTFWFGIEGEAVISMKSYVSNQKGYENIELLEACDFYKIKAKDLQNLFEKDLSIANWGRKFAEQELVKTEERLISKLFGTASERYLQLMQEHPNLLQRVALGHIASYLGITQVSLSRIRAEIR